MMQTTFEREYLLNKVNKLKGITKLRSLMPILRNVLIDSDARTIVATDLEISAITGFKAPEDAKLNVCVPGGILAEILAGLKGEEISLDTNEKGQLVISSGDFEAGIAVADPEEFPEVVPLNEAEAFNVTGGDFTRAILKTLYAVSVDETRYILTGLMMQVKDGKFIVCATDGFRLALWRKDLPNEPPDTPQIVIPGRDVKILKEIIGETARVGIVIEKNKVQFLTETVTVILRTIEGAFPDYAGIIDPGTGNIALVSHEDMLDAMKRIETLAKKEGIARLQRQEGLVISVESDIGYARERIECEYNTETPLNLAFNGKFILDALEHLDGDKTIMKYHDTYGAFQFEDIHGAGSLSEEYICVVMPVRVDVPPLLERQRRAESGEQETEDKGPEAPAAPPEPEKEKKEKRPRGTKERKNK
jgi:DNA polymerase-3 subunit beta